MLDQDTWLNTTVIELAGVGDTDADPTDNARVLVARLAELLAPAEVFLVILVQKSRPAAETGSRTEPAVVAASSELAARLARLRGPQLVTAAADAGLRVHFTLPMGHDDEAIGTVSVLSTHDQAPSDADIRLAQTLIEVAAISFLQRRDLRASRQVTQQLQHALDSRVIIEQGKGAVAARLGVTPDEAFEVLRTYARAHSIKLGQVADDVLSGQISAEALGTTPAANSSATRRTRHRRHRDEPTITS
jgi:hypothetical protein